MTTPAIAVTIEQICQINAARTGTNPPAKDCLVAFTLPEATYACLSSLFDRRRRPVFRRGIPELRKRFRCAENGREIRGLFARASLGPAPLYPDRGTARPRRADRADSPQARQQPASGLIRLRAQKNSLALPEPGIVILGCERSESRRMTYPEDGLESALDAIGLYSFRLDPPNSHLCEFGHLNS